jgi:hypothetical protein
MRKTTTYVLAALLALQVGLLVGRGRGSDAAPAGRKAAIFPGLTVEQVARVKIADRNGESLELAREGGGWVIASAGGYPAKADAVEKLVKKIVELESLGVAGTNPASQAAFEVSERLFQRDVRLLDAQGGEKARLLLGRQAAGGSFVRRAGDDAVHRVAESLVWQAATQPQSFMETQLVKLEPAKVKELSIAHGKTVRAALAKDEKGTWRATAPEAFEAEKAKVDEVIQALSRTYAAAPVGAKAAPEQGLDADDTLLVEAVLEDGSKAGVAIGKPATAGRRYARAVGASAVAEVATGSADAIDKDAAFFRPAPPAPAGGGSEAAAGGAASEGHGK